MSSLQCQKLTSPELGLCGASAASLSSESDLRSGPRASASRFAGSSVVAVACWLGLRWAAALLSKYLRFLT